MLSRGPKPSTTAVLAGSLSPGAASWNRPVSIGLHGDRVPLELDEQELAAPADRPDALADEAGQLGRRAAHGERSGGVGRRDRSAGEGGMEGVGDHGQIRQFGHGARDCSRQKACARLSRPQEAGQLKSDRQAIRRTKERTAESITTDHLNVSDTA